MAATIDDTYAEAAVTTMTVSASPSFFPAVVVLGGATAVPVAGVPAVSSAGARLTPPTCRLVSLNPSGAPLPSFP